MIDEIGKQVKTFMGALLTGDVIFEKDAASQTHDKMALEFYPAEGDFAGKNRRQNAEDIKYAVDHSTEAYWQVDKELIFTFTNAACEKVSGGFKSEDFVGRSLLEFLTPEGIETLWRVNGLRLKNEAQGIKTDTIFHELQMRRKDGTYFWAGISASPRRDERGEVIGYQGIIRDISAYKQYEMERKRHEDLLKKAERMAAVGNMTGGVAHELNNVMAGILGYSELLLLQDKLDNNVIHKHVGNIIHSGERAAAIIQDLLVMSGRDCANRTPVNLNELIPDCLTKNEFKKLSERYPGIALNLDLEPSLQPVNGALTQLDKAIMNLLSLSCEKAGPGGVVSIVTRTVYLGRPINGYDNLREGEYVILSITDNGGGIADKDVSHVFEPFYVRKVMKKGVTGLELSVARDVIKDHDGFIDVKSNVGCGATFTIYLPVLHEDMQGNYHMMSRTNHSDKTKSIN
jgi:PAS domain S-box-containing protein